MNTLCEYEQNTTLGVELLLKDLRINVNKGNLPPSFHALTNIESKEDYFYKVAQKLFTRTDVDVNMGVLDRLCRIERNTTLGVELLLNDHRIKINEGDFTPLFHSVSNVEREEDYFYKVTQMLLGHPDIDVNATVEIKHAAVSRLA